VDDPYIASGKQVLRGRKHIADAVSYDMAEKIAGALNRAAVCCDGGPHLGHAPDCTKGAIRE
jgi:hypothetical protein